MPGPHDSTRRMVPGADTSVLFLHGIIGTPRHFDTVLEMVQAVPDEWSYVNLLLPGHGSDFDAFARSTMVDWRKAAEKCFLMLSQSHRRVVLVGHSMGCLLAMELAMRFPQQTGCLFLLNVPLCPFVHPRAIGPSLRMCFGKIRADHPAEVAMKNACSVSLRRNLLCYLRWIPNYWQLFRLAGRIRRDLPELLRPCVAFQSKEDELVSGRSAVRLLNSKFIEVHILQNSAHYRYRADDAAVVLQRWCAMIDNIPTIN